MTEADLNSFMAGQISYGYVGQAVRSVLDQDFTDLELVVVEDGSTDGSFDRIHEAAGVPLAPAHLHGPAGLFGEGAAS